MYTSICVGCGKLCNKATGKCFSVCKLENFLEMQIILIVCRVIMLHSNKTSSIDLRNMKSGPISCVHCIFDIKLNEITPYITICTSMKSICRY